MGNLLQPFVHGKDSWPLKATSSPFSAWHSDSHGWKIMIPCCSLSHLSEYRFLTILGCEIQIADLLRRGSLVHLSYSSYIHPKDGKADKLHTSYIGCGPLPLTVANKSLQESPIKNVIILVVTGILAGGPTQFQPTLEQRTRFPE